MENFELVQDFFCKMHCSNCKSHFKPDGIKLLKEESGYYIIRLTCIECNQPVGIAIVGIKEPPLIDANDPPLLTDHLMKKGNQEEEPPPISYNDVINAHKFFSNLSSDWSKHIKKPKDWNPEDFTNNE